MIVTVAEPIVAVAVAVKDTVMVQVGLHPLLVKFGVTPEGRPVAENVTACEVPPERVAVIDDVELVAPCATVRLLGKGVERVKSKTETDEVKPDSCIADNGPRVPAGVPVSWTMTTGRKVPPKL